MGESIIDLLGPLRGVEGSIVATMEGWKGLLWPQWRGEGFIVDMSTIEEESYLFLNQVVYTLTFGIKSKCRPFYLFFCLQTFISTLTSYILRLI